MFETERSDATIQLGHSFQILTDILLIYQLQSCLKHLAKSFEKQGRVPHGIQTSY